VINNYDHSEVIDPLTAIGEGDAGTEFKGVLGFIGVGGPALGNPGFHLQGLVKGGTLIYLEQQAHTNLYPPAGGFYPNGGILNQITDQNSRRVNSKPAPAKAAHGEKTSS
jgi:hypothetical protein